MPPVMGSVAFVLAEATLTPYREVMTAAIIPAICYFACVYFMVDFEALKMGLRGLTRAEMPSFTGTLRKGWLLLLPILTLVYMIVVSGRSVIVSAIASTIVALAVDLIRRKKLMGWKEVLKALQEGSIGTLEAAGACAAAGIIIGIFTLTGLGNRFVDMILIYGKDNLLLCLFLVMFGVPSSGLPAAHGACLYSDGGPRRAGAGEPGGARSGGPHVRHVLSPAFPPSRRRWHLPPMPRRESPGRTRMRPDGSRPGLGIAAYIIPFAFIYNPAILWSGHWYDILWATSMGLLCGYALACGINSNYHPFLRVTGNCRGFYTADPRLAANLAGIALVAGVVFVQKYVFIRNDPRRDSNHDEK